MNERRPAAEWSNQMTVPERRNLFVLIVLYFLIIPAGCSMLMLKGRIDEGEANTLCYVLSFAYVLMGWLDYLRRDFHSLCAQRRRILVELLLSYGAMYCFNIITDSIISFAGNPNNEALLDITGTNFRELAAVSVIMAPFVEEIIFRAGVFGLLREKNRIAAYVAGVLLFSVYHVISYAHADPSEWIYVLQYIPVSFLLCRIYERTKTIWSSILLHMIINLIAVLVLKSAV